MTKLKIYIAGSWKNKEKIEYIMREIENWGYNIAVDWTKHQEKGGAKQYAEEDLKGLKECDTRKFRDKTVALKSETKQ